MKALATENAPLVGDVDAELRIVFRVVFSNASDRTTAAFEICALTAVSTPDPSTLTVILSPAVIATLTTSVSEQAPSVGVGDAVPIPPLTILSGFDSLGQPVDSDGDSNPGVTIAASVGLFGSLFGYAGLTVQASFAVSLTDTDTLEGTGRMSSVGMIFGSNNPILPTATISVVPTSPDIPLTIKRVPKDIACSEVLKAFP